MIEKIFTYAALVSFLIIFLKKMLLWQEKEYKIHYFKTSKLAKDMLSTFVYAFNISILVLFLSTRFNIIMGPSWRILIEFALQISIIGMAISFQCWPDILYLFKQFKVERGKIVYRGIMYCRKDFVINGCYFDNSGNIRV